MIGVGICHAFPGIVCGQLSPVVVSVGEKVVKDVYDPRLIRFAARSPEVDDILQARRNQPLECLAVLFKAPEKLVLGQHREGCLGFLLARDPFEPDPFAHHQVTQQFRWPGLRFRLRIDKLYPLTIGPVRVLHQPKQFSG